MAGADIQAETLHLKGLRRGIVGHGADDLVDLDGLGNLRVGPHIAGAEGESAGCGSQPLVGT